MKLKKILLGILGVIAAVVVIVLIIAATKPATFRLERSITVSVPPAAVFPHVNDFHNWRAWSPWEKVDPNLQRTYEGPTAGEGAAYAWEGNSDIGSGRMTITESQPDELIRIRLEFLKPFEATNTAEFTFQPEGESTKVTWSMVGENTFMGKVISVFMDMDQMVGGSFEEGLQQLKTVAEADTAS